MTNVQKIRMKLDTKQKTEWKGGNIEKKMIQRSVIVQTENGTISEELNLFIRKDIKCYEFRMETPLYFYYF